MQINKTTLLDTLNQFFVVQMSKKVLILCPKQPVHLFERSWA